jgi:hypothetical protein
MRWLYRTGKAYPGRRIIKRHPRNRANDKDCERGGDYLTYQREISLLSHQIQDHKNSALTILLITSRAMYIPTMIPNAQ